MRKAACSVFDEFHNRELAFSDFMAVVGSEPVYIHSPVQDTDCYVIQTKDNEIWVSSDSM